MSAAIHKRTWVVLLLLITGIGGALAWRAASADSRESSLGVDPLTSVQKTSAATGESIDDPRPDREADKSAAKDAATPNGATAAKTAGADITIEHEKAEYFLGENVVLHWHIVNVGRAPLKFEIGGDGRTPDANRAIRFKVEATDADGKPALDPYPHPANFGGLGSSPTLKPGDDCWDDLQLMRYREITQPGVYTIRVYHDLGWEKPEVTHFGDASSEIPAGPRQAPVATTTIRFLMPNAEQARKVFDDTLAMPKDFGRLSGKKGASNYPDFDLLRYPVYLPMAKELASRGDERGLEAISAMAFPDATAALLELMKSADANIAAKAGTMVIWRTPDVQRKFASRRNYLAERSWTDDLKQAAAAPAWKLLAEDDREGLIRGAEIVQSLGAKEDLPALIKVMDRVLPALKDHKGEQRAYPRPRIASETLERASRELLRRGAVPPDSAASPGRAIAWQLALGADETFRPDGWRETTRGLIKHEIPYLRDVALRNQPLPLDDATVAAVAEAIEDPFPPVKAAACALAFKVKAGAFGPPLVDVLSGCEDIWVVQGAFRAAAECGVDNDRRLEICIRRMRPYTKAWNLGLLGLLIDGAVESRGGYGAPDIDIWTAFLPDMQTAWLEFIEAHRQELRSGTKFSPADPPLSAKMFPPGFQFSPGGKTAWPPKAPE